MFTYKTLSKEKGVVTIKLINNPEEIYVPAKNYDRDVSGFEL